MAVLVLVFCLDGAALGQTFVGSSPFGQNHDSGQSQSSSPKPQQVAKPSPASRASSSPSQRKSADIKKARLLFNSGGSKMDRGDYDGAIEDLTTAVRLLPKEDAIYARRGTARMFKQDYEGAVADLSAAIAINPNGAYAYEIRGLARQSQSDFDAAIADYTKAILLDPVDGTTFRSRARARAERLWSDKTRANNPNVSIPETLNALQEAESDYAEALRLNPKDAEATAALKDIQAELTRTKEALHPVQQNPKRAQAPTVDIPTARSIAPDRSESRPIDYPGEKYPETRTRLIGEMEAATMSSAQLRYAINEVYARHGGEFRSEPEIHDYFQKFSWYHPKKGASRDQVENEFSEIERANVDLLARYKDQKK